MNRPEILAPAGSFESLEAAVKSGADAVYFGAGHFNARRNAANFSHEQLTQAAGYCHACGVLVYLALNTLVSDGELPDALELVRLACEIPVDAIIVQDIGMASLIRRAAPGMRLHASTQMSVHTPAGVNFLAEQGFSRVVLARELSKSEIAQIAETAKDKIELEMFVHGAHCMSVSGQCYLSSVLGGRSGNRGLCAQPCRLPFNAGSESGFDLSLKDLSLLEHVRELVGLGITSLKIEGRMKRPEYVATAVTAYRQAVLGQSPSPELVRQLGAVFSRTGFADGYYKAQRGKNMFGTRRREDSPGPQVLRQLHALYNSLPQTVPVRLNFSMKSGLPVCLTAECEGKTTRAQGEIPQPARTRPLDRQRLVEQLSKTGGTPFFAQSVDIGMDNGLTLPLSAVNALRREVLERLFEMRKQKVKIDFFEPQQMPQNRRDAGDGIPCKKIASFRSHTQIPESVKNRQNPLDLIFLPLDTPLAEADALTRAGLRIGFDIPRGLFGREAEIKNRLNEIKAAGVTAVQAWGLDAVALAVRSGMTVYGGTGLNLFNGMSAGFLRQTGLAGALASFELTAAQINRLESDLPLGVFAYGRLPLMLCRCCPGKNADGCARCGGNTSLTDRKNISFPVVCDGSCAQVLNSRTLWIADRLDEFRADYFYFSFTDESAEECAEVLAAYANRKPPQGEYTRGLYWRTVY